MGHPLLHEIFKATIKLYPSLVFAQLQKYYHSWRVLKYDIFRTFEEVELDGGPRRFIDVVYLGRKHEFYYPRAIFHEVKTGAYDLKEVWEKYHGRCVTLRWKEGVLYRKSKFGVCPLFIWAWNSEHLKNIDALTPQDRDILKAMRYGSVRLVPLETIVPVLKLKLLDALDSSYNRLVNWKPKDYSKIIKEMVNKKHNEWR